MADVDKITVKQLAQQVRSRDSRFMAASDDMIADWAVKNQPELGDRLLDYQKGPTEGAQVSGPTKGKSRLKEKAYSDIDVVTKALPDIGGIAGATLGSGWMSVPGAALGGAAGASGRDVIRARLFGEKPRDLRSEVTELGKEAGIQAANQALGLGMAKPFKAFGKMMGETSLRSGRIPLTPTQAGLGGQAMGWLERFTSHAIPSAGVMEGFFEKQNAKVLEEVGKDIASISKFNGTPEEMGNLLRSSIENYRTTYKKEVIDPAYDEIRRLVEQKTVRVPIQKEVATSLVDESGKPLSYAKRVLQKQQTGGVTVDTREIVKAAIPLLRAIRAQKQLLPPLLLANSEELLTSLVKSRGKGIPFSVAMQSRSDLLALSRQLEDVLPGKRAGIIKYLQKSVDRSLEDAAKNSGIADLPDMVRRANALTRDMHERFDKQLIGKILETQKPEMVSGLARKAGLQELRDLKTMLTAPQFRTLSATVAKDILAESVDKGTGVINPGAFAKKFYGLGEFRGRELFGASYDGLKELADIMDRLPGQKAGRITLGSGAAGLHNLSFVLGFGAAAGTAMAGRPEAALIGAGGLAAEAVLLRRFAHAITNPAKSARYAAITAKVLQGSPYAADTLRRLLSTDKDNEANQ